MGNVDSSNAFAGVDQLKDALTGLETRLASIEAGHRQALRDSELDASNEEGGGGGLRPSDASGGGGGAVVAGATLLCDRYVSILTGPVVGLVTGDTARILLEVDRTAEITCHVCLVDESCPQGREVQRVKMVLAAHRPQCFALTRLLPGERYVCSFGGVARADALSKVADFRTVDLAAREVRVVAVSGDRPESVGAGEFNLWETIFERLRHEHLPQVTVTLHAGGNVHLRQAFEDAWVLLKRNAEVAEQGAFEAGGWAELCDLACERLRHAYRFAWNLPFTREVLASSPHLMLGGDDDLYPNFSLCAELSAEAGGFVAATMLRLGRRVYWEYQRQLWDENTAGLLALDDKCALAAATTVEARLTREQREKAVARADAAVLELKNGGGGGGGAGGGKKSGGAVVEAAEGVLQTRRSDLMEATAKEQHAMKAESKASAALSAVGGGGDGMTAPLESSLICVTGFVGFLFVDTKFSALSVDGSPLPAPDATTQVFLPDRLWAMLEKEIDQDSPLRCLVVVSALPIADTDRAATAEAAAAGGPFDATFGRWSAREKDQERLLSMLFDWKSKEPYRELLFVSGGVRCGAMSMIRDDGWPGSVQGAGRARQLIVGPVTDTVAAWPLQPLEGHLSATSRFAFRHRPLRGQRNYAEALVRVPSGGQQQGSSKGGLEQRVDSSSFAKVVAAKIIGHFFEEVNVVLGPVIGLVTPQSANILVEVDAAAPVAAVLVDSLTGAEKRQLRLLPAGKPFCFCFAGLTPDRHHFVRFEGVENAHDRFGSFTTPKQWGSSSSSGASSSSGEDPRQFRFTALVVHGDSPFDSANDDDDSDGDDDGDGDGDNGGDGEGGVVSGGAVVKTKKKASSSSGFALWSCLRQEGERAWGGPDVFLHLGGQVDMSAVLGAAAALLGRAGREQAGSASALRLEDAARETLRGAYRTHWNLPGTRQALAHGCHLMLRGAGDVGEFLLGPKRVKGGGDDGDGGGGETGSDGEEGGGGGVVMAGAERAKLCALVQQVYREYQRQLWDASLGGDGGDAPLGCSQASGSGGGHGEWQFHRFGCVGFFLLDLKEKRLFGGASSASTPSEVPLLSPQQWRSLNDVLSKASQELTHLVVCSEVPFVDDSADDAEFKSSLPTHSHLAHQWPCHGTELRKLLHALFSWKTLGSGGQSREVTLLSGGAGYSLASTVDHEEKGSMRQIVCAPLTEHVERFWCEPNGSLDDDLSYAHGVPTSQRGFTLLDFKRDASGGGGQRVPCEDTLVTHKDCVEGGAGLSAGTSNNNNNNNNNGGGGGGSNQAVVATATNGGGGDDDQAAAAAAAEAAAAMATAGGKGGAAGSQRPAVLVAALERPEWLELLVERALATPAPAHCRARLSAIAALLRQPDARTQLNTVFKGPLKGGAHPTACGGGGGGKGGGRSGAAGGAFASVCAPALLVWFFKDAGDALRDVANPPSPFLVEAVARRWDDAASSAKGGGSGGGGRWARAGDPSKALSSGPCTRLALLDSEAFAYLVAEALALGVLVQDRLKKHNSASSED